MTTSMVLRAVVRRWYILVAGILLGVLGYSVMGIGSSVYQSATTVVFVSPGAAAITGVNDNEVDSLVSFASTIERQMNHGQPVQRLASANASLFGSGVRKGTQVAVPNTGGQWQYSFPYPELTVQVVGPTASWVEKTQDRLLDEISTLARDDQAARGIPTTDQITAKLTPAVGSVQYVGGTKGMRERGLAALVGLGLALGVVGAALLDRASIERATKRQREEARHDVKPRRTPGFFRRPALTRPQRGPAS